MLNWLQKKEIVGKMRYKGCPDCFNYTKNNLLREWKELYEENQECIEDLCDSRNSNYMKAFEHVRNLENFKNRIYPPIPWLERDIAKE
jgi:hypothetical protein